MLAGADPVMAANGTVTGTANSLALALGQANAARFVVPALAAIDAVIAAAPPDGVAGNADAIAALEDQKQAVVDAWNESQAPWLQDMAAVIITHITTYAEVDVETETFVKTTDEIQRIPSSIVAGEPTDGPLTQKLLEGNGTGTIS
jgi:hypothetical protein